MRQRKFGWRRQEPCLCGSGKLLEQCCMAADGHVQKFLPHLAPRGPITGYQQTGCYLAGDFNCSKGLTGEHYLSKAVLEVLGDSVRIDGMPWLASGETRTVGLNSLTARILCERHNNALSELDAEAGRFCQCLHDTHLNLSRKSLSKRNKMYLFSGEAIELWLLKVTCGICLSFASANGKKLKEDHSFDLGKVARALFLRTWDQSAGLYVVSALGTQVVGRSQVSVRPLFIGEAKRVVGADIWLFGMQFTFLFDTTDVRPLPPDVVHRPTTIEFRNERRSVLFVLSWPRTTPVKGLQLTAGARVTA